MSLPTEGSLGFKPPRVQAACVSSIVPSSISRLRLAVHRHGVRGTLDKVGQRAREPLYLDQTWVWYERPLGVDRPHASLPPGLVLTRGGASEASLLHELPMGNEWRARRWLEAGNDLWLVLDEGRPVFACMVFHGSTPTRAARGGWLPLPPHTVCLEASSTSTSYRGRGLIGPAAWSQIADRLEKTGANRSSHRLERKTRSCGGSLRGPDSVRSQLCTCEG